MFLVNEKPHLIMPMCGAGSRFYKNGYMMPKPLIEINGKPFLYWSTMSIKKYLDLADLTYVVLKQHIEEFGIDAVIKQFFPDARIEILDKILPGPVFTSLKGVENISDNAPIIFNDCDHIFRCSQVNEVFNSGNYDADGILLTFNSNEPQFSYVKYNETGAITGTVEKKVVSDHAVCGAYIFRNTKLFRNIADEYVKNCSCSEYFMSGMYSVICAKGMVVKEFLLDFHVEFGSPEEYDKAKESDCFMELE